MVPNFFAPPPPRHKKPVLAEDPFTFATILDVHISEQNGLKHNDLKCHNGFFPPPPPPRLRTCPQLIGVFLLMPSLKGRLKLDSIGDMSPIRRGEVDLSSVIKSRFLF